MTGPCCCSSSHENLICDQLGKPATASLSAKQERTNSSILLLLPWTREAPLGQVKPSNRTRRWVPSANPLNNPPQLLSCSCLPGVYPLQVSQVHKARSSTEARNTRDTLKGKSNQTVGGLHHPVGCATRILRQGIFW